MATVESKPAAASTNGAAGIPVENPATGEVITTVPAMSAEEGTGRAGTLDQLGGPGAGGAGRNEGGWGPGGGGGGGNGARRAHPRRGVDHGRRGLPRRDPRHRRGHHHRPGDVGRGGQGAG